MSKNPIIEQLIQDFGSQQKLATAVNVKQATVTAWLHQKHGITALNALKIEAITQGKYQAVDLCPQLKQIHQKP